MPVKNLLQFVQTFCFEEMTLVINTCLIFVEDCANFFLASLNIHIFYKEEETPTLLAFHDRSFLNLSISEPNNCVCDKFISTIIQNK